MHALLFTAHHIVCDGWSTNVILDELAGSTPPHRAERHALPAPHAIPRLRPPQAEWSAAPSATVESSGSSSSSTPVAPLELPTDRPRGREVFRGATAAARSTPPLYQRIKRSGAKNGCTLFATLLAGFKVLLHRLTGQDDIVVGIPAAGQSLVDGEIARRPLRQLPAAAHFASTDDPPFAELLTAVRAHAARTPTSIRTTPTAAWCGNLGCRATRAGCRCAKCSSTWSGSAPIWTSPGYGRSRPQPQALREFRPVPERRRVRRRPGDRLRLQHAICSIRRRWIVARPLSKRCSKRWLPSRISRFPRCRCSTRPSAVACWCEWNDTRGGLPARQVRAAVV